MERVRVRSRMAVRIYVAHLESKTLYAFFDSVTKTLVYNIDYQATQHCKVIHYI